MKTLTFRATIRGYGDAWWWDWDVDGVDPRDWTQAEMCELESDAWWFLVEKNRERDRNSKSVTFTFSREGMACNRRRRPAATQGPCR